MKKYSVIGSFLACSLLWGSASCSDEAKVEAFVVSLFRKMSDAQLQNVYDYL